MRISEIWKTALKAIGKNKRRSFLTMIGLIIGVSAVITVFSIGRAFEQYSSELLGLDSFDNSIGYSFTPKNEDFEENGLDAFTQEDMSRLETLDGVESVDYYDQSENGIKYAEQSIKEAGNTNRANSFKLLKTEGTPVLYGRPIMESDHINENRSVVIDEVTAKAINEKEPESLIGKSITIGGHLFEVVGIMPERQPGPIVVSQDTYVTAEIPESSYERFFKSEQHDMISVNMKPTANVEQVSKNAENMLKEQGVWRDYGNYATEDMTSQVETLRTLLTSITLLISVIGGISLFISGIGVMNMIYISVSERTKEIGVRRAMGATKGNIMKQFLLEGVTLTMLGGTIGYLFGMLFGLLISMITPLSVKPDLFTVLLAAGLSIVVGIIFSWLPAKNAAKKDIVTLLR
ncbi:permease [Enterococcus florum]|uniref:Permease n=1 Tax=Enterococcus florum TaxID=2480627 RepID=A0A4P5PE74_9ENTE|nr:ABC transporter permease [Enterococcus florum]GCF94418.1 permease [Enterococcus florum]